MNETSLRALFEGAVASRPPTPDLVPRSVRAGRRLRMRRRLVAGTALVAAIAGISAAPLAYGAHARVPHRQPPSASSFGAGTGFIPVSIQSGHHFRNAIVPLSAAGNKLGRPILLPGNGMWAVAATPDGKTLYTVDDQGQLTPVNLATGKADPSIGLPTHGLVPAFMAPNAVVPSAGSLVITPDGRRAYVGLPGTARSAGEVIPVNLASRRVERPIPTPINTYVTIDPNGRVAYAVPQGWLKDPERIRVTPISLTGQQSPRPITLAVGYPAITTSMTFSPDGRTAYACSVSEEFRSVYISLIPINTATATPGPRIVLRMPSTSQDTYFTCGVSFSADGRTAFIGVPGEVFPVDVATGKSEAAIRLPTVTGFTWVSGSDGPYVYAIGAAPIPEPGQTWRVTIAPINASTRTALKPVSVHVSQLTYSSLGQQIGRLIIWNDITVAPDGVAYIGLGGPISLGSRGHTTLIPVSLETGRRERPITFQGDLGTALTIYPR